MQHLRFLVRLFFSLPPAAPPSPFSLSPVPSIRAIADADPALSPQVVDEADRLLTQSFHDWLPTVLSALKPSPPAAVDPSVALPAAAVAAVAEDSAPVGLKRADAVAPLWWDAPFKEGVAVGIGRVEGEGEERSFGSVRLPFSPSLSLSLSRSEYDLN